MRTRGRRAIRCIYCQSLNTVKNGSRTITAMGFGRGTTARVSRYRCAACGRFFSLRREKGQRYTVGFKLEVARMHVEERMSYRVMAKRIDERFGKRVSPHALCEMVNEVAAHAKGSLAMQQEFHPQWSGYLLLDDKYVSIRGTRVMSLVAADKTGDALHSDILVRPEQGEFTNFVRFIVERLEYPLKALTTDFDERFGRALEALNLGAILHQRCIWHGLQTVQRMMNHMVLRQRYGQLKLRLKREQEKLEDRKRYPDTSELERLAAEFAAVEQQYLRQCELLNNLKDILYEPQSSVSREMFTAFRKFYRRQYPQVVAWLEANLEIMLVHQLEANIPMTSNIAENLNKQMERRFKSIEAFQSVDTASNYQTLLRNYLRFKPYTDCRGERKIYNGKSPLELCGVVLESRDWVRLGTFWGS
jgi:hypothetical protein